MCPPMHTPHQCCVNFRLCAGSMPSLCYMCCFYVAMCLLCMCALWHVPNRQAQYTWLHSAFACIRPVPIAFCLLATAQCLLPIAYHLSPIIFHLLPSYKPFYCILHIAYCLLPFAYCLLRIGHCLLPNVWALWFLQMCVGGHLGVATQQYKSQTRTSQNQMGCISHVAYCILHIAYLQFDIYKHMLGIYVACCILHI